ncbi:hypothetical protein FSP39_015494 [Pinctada imbricata]|uniref:Uncharacterized protein n=1 Tax=Pinctada imbricata TaxID=66713 RepID=A0AA88Y935_PINIB|nr:hypothetical protein FSP39_015494 [Pinctada imbricata]
MLFTDANCTFPDGLTGEWVSATRGDLLFNSTSIRNYPTSANLGNIFNFNCMIKKDDLYFLRAEEFINVFGRITRFYLCMEIRRLSDGLMYYYMATEFDRFADDYIFGESENHDDNQAIMEEACNVAQPYSAGTYVTLVRKVYVPTTTPGPPPDVSFLYYLLIIPAVLLLFWLICLLILLLRLCYVKYGCFCKQIWKRPRKDFNAGHGEKVEKKKFSKNKLKPLLPRELTESHLFKPKRPVDISQYFLNFESGRKPVIEPMSKISPLYQDSIMDYMHGKMARRPSAASVYSFGSIVFDNMGFAYSRALTTSTLVSEVSVVTEENSSEADDTSTSDSVQSSCDSDVASQH